VARRETLRVSPSFMARKCATISSEINNASAYPKIT
jgi:hypothetical protein